ncbi:hypothetical protein [Parvicella tangerina]|uniref:DUF4340 domain-containing protein n=1 Tax=Parvicella tangerina TaxID=2829795 RepID=A0A916JP23_9FLAO|nr:hypothetical protein [Parvicella tangerina]CAG5084851.1 hypothetical protein CRYO30217_02582 [Parvicella tangerina]
MKKILPLIILVIALIVGGIYAYSLYQSEREVAEEPLSDFSIKDTAKVDKVVITEKDIGSITLLRKKNGWFIASTGEKAQPYNINLILETAYQIQVKQSISEDAKENVIQQLAIRHKKVEYFFEGEDEPKKIWYVGGPTNDHMGTYMLLEVRDPETGKMMRSPEPFIMHKPGVYGTLDTRYFTSINEWKFPGVFIYKPGEIAQIEVENHKVPEDSYKVEVTSAGKVKLLNWDESPVAKFDSSAVKHFVSHYTEIYYESDVKHLTPAQQDSVLSLTPIFTLTVTDKKGEKTEARIWDNFNETESGGLAMDIGRALCSVNGSNQLVKVQYYSWDVLMKPKSYFLPKQGVEYQFSN